MTIPLLNKITSNLYLPILGVLFLLGLGFGFCFFINRFLSLSRTLVFYPFFVMGYFKKKSKKFNFEIKTNNIIKVVLIMFTLFVFTFLIRLNLFSNNSYYMADPYNGLNHNIFQRFLIYIFSTIMIVLLCSLKISKTNKLVEYISKNTLIIFLLHGLIVNTFKHFKILGSSNFSVLISFFISVVIVIILTVIGVYINMLKNIINKKKANLNNQN